ncbi:MAG TPA: peptidoglycan editing factor PgeF [Burkholderiales bacterium]|nr:peptidoglycan editing factor PgeF [Burkholderiales bacterium]
MTPELIVPDWPAPARVRALVTTRALGDAGSAPGRARLRPQLPSEPPWLRQVHGTRVVDAASAVPGVEADAAVARQANVVCAVMAADCMPVLLADEAGGAVGAAHAGWRGLAAGVLEAAVDEMRVPGARLLAWLGPAIGPRAYEVGDEVRAAFVAREARAGSAFAPSRPGHWLLDLYAVARQRLEARGVRRVWGGGYCTFSEPERFFSWRRERTAERMVAAIWLA